MKIIAITYGGDRYRDWQILNSSCAKNYGMVDEIRSYSQKDIDAIFYNTNIKILNKKRGSGYWLWKPYIILKALNEISEGDFLIYTDSGGIQIVGDVHSFIEELNEKNCYIWIQQMSHVEKKYTKRDVFILIDCDKKEYCDTGQYKANVIVIKKCQESIHFVKQWLFFCTDERILTDIKNQLNKENYEGFVENRHDQSALSLLYKKAEVSEINNISAEIGDINSKYLVFVRLHHGDFILNEVKIIVRILNLCIRKQQSYELTNNIYNSVCNLSNIRNKILKRLLIYRL